MNTFGSATLIGKAANESLAPAAIFAASSFGSSSAIVSMKLATAPPRR
jgi:hypothetical protein